MHQTCYHKTTAAAPTDVAESLDHGTRKSGDMQNDGGVTCARCKQAVCIGPDGRVDTQYVYSFNRPCPEDKACWVASFWSNIKDIKSDNTLHKVYCQNNEQPLPGTSYCGSSIKARQTSA